MCVDRPGLRRGRKWQAVSASVSSRSTLAHCSRQPDWASITSRHQLVHRPSRVNSRFWVRAAASFCAKARRCDATAATEFLQLRQPLAPFRQRVRLVDLVNGPSQAAVCQTSQQRGLLGRRSPACVQRVYHDLLPSGRNARTWQRLTIVGKRADRSWAVRQRTTCGGGSSRVFRSLLAKLM